MQAREVDAARESPPAVAAPRAATRSVRGFVRTVRPHQWVKNVFVAMPLVFSRHLVEPAYALRAGLAMLAFCALSGAVYAFNDVRDAEADRRHATKRHRPIAAGELSERAALIGAVCLATAAIAGCVTLSWQLAALAVVYLVQNIAYTLRLKQIAFVDVAVIASGFLVRVLAGAAAISVPASHWLLLCTALLALFLGLGKRGHELAWAARSPRTGTTRAALAGYRIEVVQAVMLALAVLTSAAFVAYTLWPHTIAFFGTDRLIYVSPFVVLGVVRFLMLALWRPGDEPPTDAMLRDPLFLLDLAGASAMTLYAIYG
jgi:decaprenyl-phosphate phosphoribosyltransferase